MTVRKWTIAASVLIAAFLFYGLVVHPFLRPVLWRWQGKYALGGELDQARLREAVGKWGVFVPVKDGSWIAIRYDDLHGGGVWSLAIARDSDGRWYESRHHFCAGLRAFGVWIEAQTNPMRQTPTRCQT